MSKTKCAFILIAALAALGSDVRAQETGADQDVFAREVAKVYERAGLAAEVVGRLELEVASPDGGVAKAFLDTVYRACVRDRAQCATLVERQVEATAANLAYVSTPPKLSDLRVTVRPQAYVDQLEAASGADPVIAEPLAGELWVIGAIDQPKSIRTLSKRDLESLKLTADAAIEAGRRNLDAAARARIAEAIQAGGGAVGMFKGDDYTSSLIASPELWEPLADACGGELWVAVPASDVVLFADARKPELQTQIRAAARATAALAKRPISADVYEWTPAGWNKIGAPGLKL
jgi:hypothetical protein